MFWFFGLKACGILALLPGIEPTPPALEGKLLTTGPPGKSTNEKILDGWVPPAKHSANITEGTNVYFFFSLGMPDLLLIQMYISYYISCLHSCYWLFKSYWFSLNTILLVIIHTVTYTLRIHNGVGS